MRKALPLLLPLALFTACKSVPNEPFIPVIGLNEEGKTDVHYVPKKVFNERLSPFLTGLSNEVSGTLNRVEKTEAMPWTLSRVSVGLNLSAQMDVLHIFTANAQGEFELRFQKN